MSIVASCRVVFDIEAGGPQVADSVTAPPPRRGSESHGYLTSAATRFGNAEHTAWISNHGGPFLAKQAAIARTPFRRVARINYIPRYMRLGSCRQYPGH
jgi:hypothetical protein